MGRKVRCPRCNAKFRISTDGSSEETPNEKLTDSAAVRILGDYESPIDRDSDVPTDESANCDVSLHPSPSGSMLGPGPTVPLSAIVAQDLMQPMDSATTLNVASTFVEACVVVCRSSEEWFPVRQRLSGKYVGVLHRSDLLNYGGTLREFDLSNLMQLPKRILATTSISQIRKRHTGSFMALIVDPNDNVIGNLTDANLAC